MFVDVFYILCRKILFQISWGLSKPCNSGPKTIYFDEGNQHLSSFSLLLQCFWHDPTYTPPKTNVSPENWWLEDEISLLKWGLIPNTHGLKRLSSALNIVFFRIFGVYVYKMSLDLDSHNGQSQYPLITNKYLKCILSPPPKKKPSTTQGHTVCRKKIHQWVE